MAFISRASPEELLEVVLCRKDSEVQPGPAGKGVLIYLLGILLGKRK